MHRTYLGGMKTKLTLSISRDRVRKIKAFSSKRKKSVSEFFEEVIDGLDHGIGRKKADRIYSVDQLEGLLTGKFSKKDLANDPRLAHIMGKR